MTARRRPPLAALLVALAALPATARAAGADPAPAPALAPALAPAPSMERFTGVARLADGRVAYLEEHEVRRDAEGRDEALTTYRAPSGEVLATLRSDFSRNPAAPDYVFEDRRRGAVESMEVAGGTAMLIAGATRRAIPVPADRPLVGGQGLDRLVRARLQDLARGEVLRVEFAFPARQATYGFTVRARPAPPGAATLPVRVEVDSWVLRLFAEALDCEYDLATGRLLRYRGPTNLEDEGGRHPVVTITYDWPPVGSLAEAGEARHAAR